MRPTDEERRIVRDRAERAEQKARKRFHRIMEVAERAGTEAEAKAAAWAGRKGYSPGDANEISLKANREAQLLIWIKVYLRTEERDIERAFDMPDEERFVEEALEAAGELAAAELGLDDWRWWECAYDGEYHEDESV